jgi:hypothetical protein
MSSDDSQHVAEGDGHGLVRVDVEEAGKSMT